MPALFDQILKQPRFEPDFDAKLELNARVSKKLDQVEALKARGLSLKEIQMEAEGGSAILQFLKDHDMKQKQKAAVQKVIDRNQDKINKIHDELYGVQPKFME